MFILKRLSIYICACLLLCMSIAACGSYEPPGLQVDSPENGAVYDVNIQKLSGVVSDPQAKLTANGNAVPLAADGSFYVYLELTEGENVIRVEASGDGGKCSRIINVGYTPPLAVYVSIESGDRDTDYSVCPLTATGWVSDARAQVTVNGNPVQVDIDGNYSTQVQLEAGGTAVSAVAVLDGRQSEMSYLTGIGEEGGLLRVPGWSIFYMFRMRYDHYISLKAGETGAIDATLDTRLSIRYPDKFNYKIYCVGGEYEEEEIAAPDGLVVYLEPSRFTVYPNTIYNLKLVVAAAGEVPPGDYFYCFKHGFGENLGTRDWIKITVE